MSFGVDFAFHPHPPDAALVTAGASFAGRYVSSLPVNDSNGKNLVPVEKSSLRKAGLDIVLFVEEGSGRMLGGQSAGIADAKHFDSVVKALGMAGAVGYFAADFDATEAQQGPINAYLDGAASVIGRERTGIYGGYYPVKRALDAGKARFACQTIAWSGGQWDSRAHIRQGLQVSIGGVSVDVDHSMKADYGQWPRPGAPVARAGQPPASPQKLTADGKLSLRQAANAHGTAVQRALWLMAHDPAKAGKGWGGLQKDYIRAADWDAPMPSGMTYWVG